MVAEKRILGKEGQKKRGFARRTIGGLGRFGEEEKDRKSRGGWGVVFVKILRTGGFKKSTGEVS